MGFKPINKSMELIGPVVGVGQEWMCGVLFGA